MDAEKEELGEEEGVGLARWRWSRGGEGGTGDKKITEATFFLTIGDCCTLLLLRSLIPDNSATET